jgi:putative copper export protein/mono/diheme cytochrome c family protein
MPEPMTLIRAAHYAAMLLAAGGLAFWAFVVPAKRVEAVAARYRAAMISGAILALLSAVLWLGGEAAGFPALPGAATPGLGSRALNILGGTGFGHAWIVRLILLLALVLVVVPRPTRARLGVGALLGLAATATLAFAGHAAAGDSLRRTADMLHLTLAALWLGGLLPLAALLRAASRNASARALPDARVVTERFSNLGVASVGWLLATGLVNAWALVGSIPGLVGTGYGRLLCLKLFLFLCMVGIAAVNRQVLTPALDRPEPRSRIAARRLARNAAIEAALGLLILLDVGALGVSVPATHDQISWPLPVTWSLAAAAGQPTWQLAAVAAAFLVVLGLTLAGFAALGHRHRGVGISGGAGIAFMGVVLGGVALSEPAVPTIYLTSPLPYSAATIAPGAQTFAEQCVACHGPHGYGDGPAAVGLPVKPADLARQHVGFHTDGTFFWWISHGKGEAAMPAFADVLDEPQRWEVIGFLHALYDAETAQGLGPRIDPALRLPAPDFAYERGGTGQQTLGMLREAWSVLLVLYSLPGSEPRLKSLSAAAKQLDLRGLRIIAVPIGEGAEKGSIFTPGDPDLVATYELFRKRAGDEAAPPDHLEYYIDAWGYLRARFGLADAPTPEQLVAMMAAVDREPPPPPVGQAAHTHGH